MAEEQWLFNLDYDEFNRIRGRDNLFELREEFNTRNAFLSQSLLISQETADSYWLLADFENQKTYNIRKENDTRVEVSEGVDIGKHTDILSDAGTIIPRLQQGVGTHMGTIDALKRLNFNTVNLENLKRIDLSARNLSFESVYPDLEVAYKMLYEILAAPRPALINLSSRDLQQLKKYVLQSYEMTQKIVNFGVGERDPDIRKQHANLSREIHQFCENVKQSLFQIAAYLSSRTVDQLENQVKTALTDAEEKLSTAIDTGTEKLQKLGEETQQQTAEIVQKLEQTHLKYQNQLTEKPISQYKTIFETQAKNHRTMAWVWFATSGLLAVGFGLIFWKLLTDIGSLTNQEDQLSMILSNLFAKGFYLSLIFLFLNRTIKNFAAEKHLEVTNTHRQNALETFDTFVAAAEGNRDTRDQVLLAATKAIFDANQSGYLSTKTSSSDSASPVQQIIKEVIPTKSSDKSD